MPRPPGSYDQNKHDANKEKVGKGGFWPSRRTQEMPVLGPKWPKQGTDSSLLGEAFVAALRKSCSLAPSSAVFFVIALTIQTFALVTAVRGFVLAASQGLE